MGFDLYGVNPNNPKNLTQPTINWSEENTEKEKEDYFKELTEFENAVPGHYFRANVWGWRPIWTFVSDFCSDILSERDLEKGDFNDGKKIGKTKAKKVAARIRRLHKDGTLDKYADVKYEIYETARRHNKKITLLLDKVNEMVQEETGDKDIVPADYPRNWKEIWDEVYRKKDWNGYYPFSKESIIDFAEFCEQSGGFEIC